MLKICFVLIVFLLFNIPEASLAQDTLPTTTDSAANKLAFVAFPDSLLNDSIDTESMVKHLSVEDKTFKPDPGKAVIYSAIFPGLGQIYNRKYWKLPIVYGGFLGCIYAITWNGNQYEGYKKAYNDITDNGGSLTDDTKSWEAYVPYSWRENGALSPSRQSDFTKVLKNKKDYYRRDRDLSYIVTVGVYVLCMIDAYVDAQLFDFDISRDLSLKINPVVSYEKTLGLQCSFRF